MENKQITNLVEEALSQFLKNEAWLLNENLSEPCMSHRLAIYLHNIFEDYDVDCEYNGNVSSPGKRKKILLVREELNDLKLLKDKDHADVEEEFIERAAFPDIIVHKRGTNEGNLCIIEVKKDSSTVSYEYDYLKLKAYTRNSHEQDLKYQLGIFVEFITGKQPDVKLQFFQNGIRIDN